jgi:hypothetical protein
MTLTANLRRCVFKRFKEANVYTLKLAPLNRLLDCEDEVAD